MSNFNYLKLTRSKKIRYLKLIQRNSTYLVFLHGFMSDLEGKKPKKIFNFAKKNKKDVKKIFAKKTFKGKFPLNPFMSLKKMNKLLK